MQNPFNQVIVLEPFIAPLDRWQLPTTALSSIYIALMTTLLSYQLTAIANDLLQGRFQANYTSASALQAHLLAINPSPLAILSALCRNDWVDRCHFGNLPPGTFPRSKNKIGPCSVCSLLLLVMAAPVASMLAVFVTFERSKVFSIGQTNFGGVALGAGEPMKTKGPIPGRCIPITFSVPSSFVSRVEFIRCTDMLLWQSYPDTDFEPVIAKVEVGNDGSVQLSVSGPYSMGNRIEASIRLYAVMETENGSFRIAHAFTRQAMERVIHEAVKAYNNSIDKLQTVEVIERERYLFASQKFTLTNGSFFFQEPFTNMLRSVQLVRTTEMLLLTNDYSLVKAEGTPFVESTHHMLSEGALGILVLALVVVRIALRCLLVNNVEAGIDAMLKSYLSEEKSLLRRSDEVRYNYLYVVDREIWYGVERHGLEEFQAVPKQGIIL